MRSISDLLTSSISAARLGATKTSASWGFCFIELVRGIQPPTSRLSRPHPGVSFRLNCLAMFLMVASEAVHRQGSSRLVANRPQIGLT
jgi:hypothetical protein